jgi:hypothetical protein
MKLAIESGQIQHDIAAMLGVSSVDNFISQDAAKCDRSLSFAVVVQTISHAAFTARYWTVLIMNQSEFRWHRIVSDGLGMHELIMPRIN